MDHAEKDKEQTPAILPTEKLGQGQTIPHPTLNTQSLNLESGSSVSMRSTKLKRRATEAPITEPVQYLSFACGILAGVAQAGVFNPYDRALYLSIKDDVHFLSPQNWKNPYGGFFQSVGGRALSGGLYFPLEHLYLRMLDADEINSRNNLIAGTAAGATNACILNPLSAVKVSVYLFLRMVGTIPFSYVRIQLSTKVGAEMFRGHSSLRLYLC